MHEEIQRDILKGMSELERIEAKLGDLSPSGAALLAIQRECITIVNEAVRHQKKDEHYAANIKLEIADRLNKIVTAFLNST